jgi:hypothetical protein
MMIFNFMIPPLTLLFGLLFQLPQAPIQPEEIPENPEPDRHDDEHHDVQLVLSEKFHVVPFLSENSKEHVPPPAPFPASRHERGAGTSREREG